MSMEFIVVGAVAGLAKAVVQDGGIVLPKVKDGELFLGGLTSVVLGAIVAGVFGSNIENAFFTGYSAPIILEHTHDLIKK